jgi:hypothetical protein
MKIDAPTQETRPMTAKLPKPSLDQSRRILREALEPQREGYTLAVFAYLRADVERVVQHLIDAEWDAHKAAPYPHSRMSGLDYHIALKLYKDVRSWSAVPPLAEGQLFHKSRGMNDPEPRAPLDGIEIVERLRKEADKITKSDFDSYANKLAAKVAGKSTSPVMYATVVGQLWLSSTLNVEMLDGGKQSWNTQMILNRSVHGKLFNQWPTRFIS